MNIKITFLNGDSNEEVYMEQFERFIVNKKEKYICKLIKSLYGLKQSSK